MLWIIILFQELAGLAEDWLRKHQRLRLTVIRHLLQTAMQFIGGTDQLVASFMPGFVHLLQHLKEAWAAELRLGWPVRASIKRFQVRSEKHVQRPSALSGHGLHKRHVNAIDVRTFLAIDLYTDKLLVEVLGRFNILERFTFHDVAPMTRRVANAQENRLVLAARFLEGLSAPRVPVDWVVLVLQKIRRLFACQAVGVRRGRL
jgi:hypothetical protein